MVRIRLTGAFPIDGVESIHARCLLCRRKLREQMHTFGCLMPDSSIGISERDKERREHSLEVDDLLCGLVCQNKCKGMRQRSSAQLCISLRRQPDSHQKSQSVIRKVNKLRAQERRWYCRQ